MKIQFKGYLLNHI